MQGKWHLLGSCIQLNEVKMMEQNSKVSEWSVPLQTSSKGLHFGMLRYVRGCQEWGTKGHEILRA